MVLIRDCFGNEVVLTAERLQHILEHPEMLGLEKEIRTTVESPAMVRRSRADHMVRLFYEFYARTVLGGKWLCVVVKYAESRPFVVTAYLTAQPKAGEDLWPIR